MDEISSRKGSAGGNARAAQLSLRERWEVASKAVRSRWSSQGNRQEADMMQTAKSETVARGREAVCMYPNNSLKEPVRDYQNVVAEVVKNTFTK